MRKTTNGADSCSEWTRRCCYCFALPPAYVYLLVYRHIVRWNGCLGCCGSRVSYAQRSPHGIRVPPMPRQGLMVTHTSRHGMICNNAQLLILLQKAVYENNMQQRWWRIGTGTLTIDRRLYSSGLHVSRVTAHRCRRLSSDCHRSLVTVLSCPMETADIIHRPGDDQRGLNTIGL